MLQLTISAQPMSIAFNTKQIHASWRPIIDSHLRQPYFRKLRSFIDEERKHTAVYPQTDAVFNALAMTPFDTVVVVILGQDPYHQQGQANGLAFSVPPGIRKPPSLRNIFKELQNDCNLPEPTHGDLSSWARQGVLLLNTVLTVREDAPQSHALQGWESLTDAIITGLSTRKEGVIFLLWGAKAQAKIPLIDQSRHTILTAAHPSPLSAYAGFFGCRHFSATNTVLRRQCQPEIDWAIG